MLYFMSSVFGMTDHFWENC